MTPALYQSVIQDGAMVNLSSRAKWILAGADRIRYLNGQVTNDVRRASKEAAIHACVTDAKGRMEGDVFIHNAPEETLVLDAEPGLREPLTARLEKYVVADDVVITDATDDWRLLHLWGSTAEQGARDVEQGTGVRCIEVNRFGKAGYDLWIPESCSMPSALCPMLSADEAETWRICQGIPRWPHELNVDAFPQEAGLESSAMDFSKGCYIGQEVLSRIKTTGKMPRRLVRFQISDPSYKSGSPSGIPGPSTRLWMQTADGLKEAGTVTSACLHPVLDHVVGLAYVRQGLVNEPLLSLAPEDTPGILIHVEISLQ